MPQEIKIDMIKFPVLYFGQKIFIYIGRTADEITTCSKAALNNGFYNDMLIVEESGKAYKVKGAKKLHGVGVFWGYDVFFNQKIKVELFFSGKPFQVSIEEIKERIFNSFEKRHGWSTRGDFEELKERVKNAKSISELIQLLS